jgi:hypothetical protein
MIVTTLRSRTALAALALSAGLAAASAAPISDITVQADLTSAGTGSALEYWPTVEADLTSRLGQALAPWIDEQGGEVTVTLTEIAVDEASFLQGMSDMNRIAGSILYRPRALVEGNTDPSQGVATSSRMEVSVEATPDLTPLLAPPPEGAGSVEYIPPSALVLYEAMLDGFADVVARRWADEM